jgi:NhaP-type Na+/H+ or K+/H+ antiporter
MREDETVLPSFEEEINAEHEQLVFYIFFLSFMIFFFTMEGIIHMKKPLIGHQTVFTILLGLVWSVLWFISKGYHPDRVKVFQFSHSAFFDFMLPPIIYNSGFNMKRKNFFTNLGNITIFGLGTTFVCFVEYSLFSWLALKSMNLTMTDYFPEEGPAVTHKVEMTIMNTLLFTSLLCSSDVVAAVSIVDFESQPKLYSCIFGEGVANDIVSIIMFNAILSL